MGQQEADNLDVHVFLCYKRQDRLRLKSFIFPFTANITKIELELTGSKDELAGSADIQGQYISHPQILLPNPILYNIKQILQLCRRNRKGVIHLLKARTDTFHEYVFIRQ